MVSKSSVHEQTVIMVYFSSKHVCQRAQCNRCTEMTNTLELLRSMSINRNNDAVYRRCIASRRINNKNQQEPLVQQVHK